MDAMRVHQVMADVDLIKKATDAKMALVKKVRRRVQSKLNQRRYRADQKALTDRLEQAVLHLHNDVARMEGRAETIRLAVSHTLRTFDHECKLSTEYFRLFDQGYDLDPTSTRHQSQFAYLTNAMSQDLVIMGKVGRDKLFEQWVLYMSTFEAFSMELHNVQLVSLTPTATVHIETTLHLRMSRKSISLLFPHLLDNEPLVQRLIGKVMHLPVQHRFIFDSNGVVQELGTHANTACALMTLLGSVDDTLTVIADFQLTEAAELVSRAG
ncbi:hypothetical protein DYB32_006735 [Aphanomyces invadans]|uniref:BZIP domain-containing protein n=1 Tax=Aphanomyces invadans TaxID=157072 RepID=A0A418AR04_9STRA|nr:hypothetical protein DYB32_006735 [Aphanomyces invadans]